MKLSVSVSKIFLPDVSNITWLCFSRSGVLNEEMDSHTNTAAFTMLAFFCELPNHLCVDWYTI